MNDKKKPRFVTYEAENCDYEFHDTLKEALEYLNDSDYSEGFSTEAMEGENFIAEITHRSKFTETENREAYHVHTDMCPVDCELEEWPYGNWDFVGDLTYEPIEREHIQTDAIDEAIDFIKDSRALSVRANASFSTASVDRLIRKLEALKARAK